MVGNKNSGAWLPPERRELLDRAVEDGWPIRQIILTYGISHTTVKNYYPDYSGMSFKEGGELAMSIRWANKRMEKSGS